MKAVKSGNKITKYFSTKGKEGVDKRIKPIPVYTVGSPKEISKKVEDPQGPYYSAFTGKQLESLPTNKTYTDDPTHKHKYYHGGIQIEHEGKKIIMCHMLPGPKFD